MSSAACLIWFLGMVALTGFFAWLVSWALKNVNEYDKEFVVGICSGLGIISFICAIAFLAGVVR